MEQANVTANALPYWLALLCAGRLKRQIAKDIIYRWCVRLNHPLEALFVMDPSELARELEIDKQQANQLIETGREVLIWADALHARAQKGVRLITRCDAAYPEALAQRLPEASLPYYFFYRGNLALLSDPALALLGTNQPSAAAHDIAIELGGMLAQEGYQLIGGYDKGIDRLALDTVRAAQGSTFIVLPLGIDGFEAPLQTLAPALDAGRLLVLSPYPPSQGYQPSLGKARLGLITAWCEALLLIEPEVAPHEWPELEPLLAFGGRVFLWANGDSARCQAWLEAGALPFDTVDTARRLLHELLGAEPLLSDGAGDIDNLPGIEPIAFDDAESAIEALGNYGRVPPQLARRLREMEGHSDDG